MSQSNITVPANGDSYGLAPGATNPSFLSETQGEPITRVVTSGGISMTPELFEKLYLTPINKAGGTLRPTFANPTPLGLVGFVIALTPLCCILMGWRGTDGTANAEVAAFYWFGGLLQATAGLLEFFVGNTFPFVVLSSFGAFFLTFASTLTPAFGAATAYKSTTGFHAAFGFFPLFMGLLCLVYLICALRTNVVFVLIFFTLIIALGFLTAAHWYAAVPNAAKATNMEVAAGGTAFVSAVAGWYLVVSQLFQALDFPLQLPVGDLSTVIKGRKQLEKKINEASNA